MRASEIFDELLVSGSEAVIVGPSASPVMDVATLYAGVRLGKRGTIYIADPIFIPMASNLEVSDTAGPIVSYGCVADYLKGTDELIEHGMRLPRYVYLGEESGIFSIPVYGISAVIDHNTSIFVYHNGKHSLPDEDFFDRVIEAYAQALESNGVLIWQFDSSLFMAPNRFVQTLCDLLRKGGFADVEHQDVDDSFDIPIPVGLRRQGVVYYMPYTRETFTMGGTRKASETHAPTMHKCDTMLTARKA